jgi:hypothetical protein
MAGAGHVAVIAVAAAVVTACGGGGERPREQQPAPAGAPPAGGHIHGLGVNPRDGALFIATHEGLFRARPGSARATRVGTSRQDTMGFTVAGPDRFLGSGHPDLRADLPPYLGLIESRDAGRTWRPRSLLGEADFHALEASGSTIYGSGSDFESREPRFLVSVDGGRSWERRRPPEPIVSIAVDPGDAARIAASGSRGLYASDDAGRTWRTLDGPPGLLVHARPGTLHLVDAGGGVHVRDGGGWSAVGDVGGAPAAFEAGAGGELLVGLHDGAVKRSTDGGRSWTLRARL